MPFTYMGWGWGGVILYGQNPFQGIMYGQKDGGCRMGYRTRLRASQQRDEVSATDKVLGYLLAIAVGFLAVGLVLTAIGIIMDAMN